MILTFHPEANTAENIKAILQQVEHIIVVDNESSEHSQKIFKGLPGASISFIYNEKNNGVAQGFNQGMRWGLQNGYDHFLLMDQDSQPKPGMVSALLDAEKKLIEQVGELILLGPQHEDFDRKIPSSHTSEIDRVPLLITSGSLLSKKLIEKIGLYDERLFIDHVDHDYCLRVLKQGGVCVKVHSACLLHRFGEARVASFLGKSFFIQDYSPFRRYHMMRNRMVLYKRYGVFKGEWFWLDLRSATKDLVKLIFFEPRKKTKLLAVAKGIWDGILWQD